MKSNKEKRDYFLTLAKMANTEKQLNAIISTVDDLGEILEESEAEKAKYSESEAEEMLTRLIYRELRKNLEKHCR